jgi:hypothetical protein
MLTSVTGGRNLLRLLACVQPPLSKHIVLPHLLTIVNRVHWCLPHAGMP